MTVINGVFCLGNYGCVL